MHEQVRFQKIDPLGLLKTISNPRETGHLQVFDGSIYWSIYFRRGKITFASHSIDPFERLDRHLLRLGHKQLPGFNETRAQLDVGIAKPSSEYSLICNWFNFQLLTKPEIVLLVERLVKEVVADFLLIKSGDYKLNEQVDSLQTFCTFELQSILEYCQKQAQRWELLAPEIVSLYQRPYLLGAATRQRQLLQQLPNNLVVRLNGFSPLCYLAAATNQDELELAKDLHPYILGRIIGLHDPHPPFNQLPKSFVRSTRKVPTQLQRQQASHRNAVVINNTTAIPNPTNNRQTSPVAAAKKTYTIVCVDDSSTMLKQINNFLDDDGSFSVFPISEPVKALMQIIRLKPHLILLDVMMASIDGYELCRLVRNHPRFKDTPIIMVTGNTGIIDRVKARLVGASGYLTKPFNQADLLKMVFKHVS